MRTLWLAIVIGIAACGYSITTEHDAVLDCTVTRMSKNVVGSQGLFGTGLNVNGAKIEEGGNVSYGLWIRTMAPEWIFPDGLVMRIDDQVVDFGRGQRLSTDTDCFASPCTHDERYYYEATADQLRSIAEATEVFVKIEGLNGYVEKQFSPENIANFQDFVSKEVE